MNLKNGVVISFRRIRIPLRELFMLRSHFVGDLIELVCGIYPILHLFIQFLFEKKNRKKDRIVVNSSKMKIKLKIMENN